MNISTGKYHLRACDANPGKAWLSIRASVCNALSPVMIERPSLAQVNAMSEAQFDKWADAQILGRK